MARSYPDIIPEVMTRAVCGEFSPQAQLHLQELSDRSVVTSHGRYKVREGLEALVEAYIKEELVPHCPHGSSCKAIIEFTERGDLNTSVAESVVDIRCHGDAARSPELCNNAQIDTVEVLRGESS
jgi:hypothetical protein